MKRTSRPNEHLMCEGKKQFTKRIARIVVRAQDEQLHAYQCPLCHAWHVGHEHTGRIPRRADTLRSLRDQERARDFDAGAV